MQGNRDYSSSLHHRLPTVGHQIIDGPPQHDSNVWPKIYLLVLGGDIVPSQDFQRLVNITISVLPHVNPFYNFAKMERNKINPPTPSTPLGRSPSSDNGYYVNLCIQ